MNIQNLTGKYCINFKAKENKANNLKNALMFIMNNYDKVENDTFTAFSTDKKNDGASSNNQDGENPISSSSEIILEEKSKQTANNEELSTVEPEEITAEDTLQETPEEKEEIQEQEEAPEEQEEAPEASEEVLAEDDNFEAPGETVSTNPFFIEKKSEHPRTISNEELAALDKNVDDDYKPRHGKRDRIPAEDAVNLSHIEIPPVQGIYRGSSKNIIAGRLNTYEYRIKKQLNVSGCMFDTACKLSPETIQSIKSEELLYLMVAKDKVLKKIFGNDALDYKERMNMLHKFEDTFTPEEMETITSDDKSNSNIITELARWLFTFNTVENKEKIKNILKTAPKSSIKSTKFNIAEYFSKTEKKGKLRRFFQGMSKKSHVINVD